MHDRYYARMDAVMIEDIVDTWPDAERRAFWELVEFKIADERVDPDEAIVEAFDSAAFVEMFQQGGES